MFDLLTPFGFPEIAIITFLLVAVIILITLNILFLASYISKKGRKKSLSEEEAGKSSADPFAGKPASSNGANGQGQSGGFVVLPHPNAPVVFIVPRRRNASAPQSSGNGANEQGQGRGPAALPPMNPPVTVIVPRFRSASTPLGLGIGANGQGQNRGLVVIPPIIRLAPPRAQKPGNSPAPLAMPQTQPDAPSQDLGKPQE